ncbi:hypothetical protein [Persicobacter diffluens]
MQEKYGYRSGCEKADKEYKEFKYVGKLRLDKATPWWAIYWGSFRNMLDKYWWDYGYSKEWIFLWTGGIFLFFTILNFSIGQAKLYDFYPLTFIEDHKERIIDKSTQISTKRYWGLNTYVTVIYTAYVFFGVKFEVNKMNYRMIGMTILFFFQYAVGLVCLGYLANTIIVGN